MDSKYNIIDLFAGCGGFSQGFYKTGFNIIAANEFWKPASQTYKLNHPDTIMIEGDITSSNIKEQIYNSVKNKHIHVIIGGPPCQGYSFSGNRNPEDPRGKLYEDFLDIISHIKPDFFIMENVKGLINMKHVNPKLNKTELNIFKANCSKLQRFKDLKRYDAQRNLNIKEKYEFLELKSDLKRIKRQINERMVPLIEKILKKIYLMGYKVEKKVLNSADYGVPQTRERIFFIGTKHKEISISFPNVTHLKNPGGNSNKLLPWKTVGDTLKKYEEWEESDEINHIFTSHSIKFIKKIRNTSIGQNIYKNYSDAFWRLDPEKPARTVKENHGGVFVHYKFDRVCTPRELATLQSFDDSFIFQGTKSDILKQIGNAVPPLLSKVLAGKIKKLLSQFNINENKLVPIISYVK